jgi:hypothetical protein
MAGSPRGIWVADADAPAVMLFDAASARTIAQVALPDIPVSMAGTVDTIAVGLQSGDVIGLANDDGRERWRRAAGSGEVRLKAWRDRLWAWDRHAATLLGWDEAGNAHRVDARGAVDFAPHAHAVYWVEGGGHLGSHRLDRQPARTTALPVGAMPAAAMVACANALWVSVAAGLLLIPLQTMEVRATIRTPEASVPHLLCFDGRLFGGGRAVFALEPAADADARPLPVHPRAGVRDLAVSGTHLWVLDAAEPLVHIVGI